MVAGTFEIIHPGHLALFRAAARLGELHVVVARDANSERFKGRKPLVPEKLRLSAVASLKIVKEAVLGGKEMMDGVRKVKPDVIYLGPDQPSAGEIRGLLEKTGLKNIRVIRMRRRFGKWRSSRLLKRLVS
jgi:FAD synthetase